MLDALVVIEFLFGLFRGPCSFSVELMGRWPGETCPMPSTKTKNLADSTMKNKNKYNFAARAALLAFALTAAFALNTTAIAQAPPGSLWYNGD
jgi:hypothetical protein